MLDAALVISRRIRVAKLAPRQLRSRSIGANDFDRHVWFATFAFGPTVRASKAPGDLRHPTFLAPTADAFCALDKYPAGAG